MFVNIRPTVLGEDINKDRAYSSISTLMRERPCEGTVEIIRALDDLRASLRQNTVLADLIIQCFMEVLLFPGVLSRTPKDSFEMRIQTIFLVRA